MKSSQTNHCPCVSPAITSGKNGDRQESFGPDATIDHAPWIAVGASILLLVDVVGKRQLACLAEPSLVTELRECRLGSPERRASLAPLRGEAGSACRRYYA